MLQHIDALTAFAGIMLLMSLLVTIITHMVVSALNLRGANLFWGLAKLFRELEPSLHGEVEEIVAKILHHPMISRSGKRLAHVIRVEELSHLIVKMSQSPEAYGLSDAAKTWLAKLAQLDTTIFEKQLANLPQIDALKQSNLKDIHQALLAHLCQARVRIIELEKWFDKITDRLSERFTLHTRIVTVGAALLITILLQVDSIDILHRVYTDAELRAKVLASTDMILQRGDTFISQRNVFDYALDSLRATTATPALPARDRSFANRLAAEEWLSAHAPAGAQDSLLTKYRELQFAITQQRLGYLGDQVLSIRGELDELGFGLITGDYGWDIRKWPFRKYLGMLVSVGLLSLGAPFWYNMLKNLANLRSRLVQNEEKERTTRRQQQ